MTTQHNGFLIDTNIVNRELDRRLDSADTRLEPALFADAEVVYSTKNQRAELGNTPSGADGRRENLLIVYAGMEPVELDTATAAAAIATEHEYLRIWDTVQNIAAELDAERPDRAQANWVDALTAEAALRNQKILITADGPLARAAARAGLTVIQVK